MLFALALAAPLLGAGASYLAYRRSDPAKLRRRAQRGSKRLALAVKRAEKEQEALDEGMAHAARGYSSGFHSARLAGTPITQLKQVGIRGARWSALEDAGIETLADLEGHGPTSLGAIHGVGTSTASGVAAGAAEMTAMILNEPVPLPRPTDLGRKDARALVEAAWALRASREELTPCRKRLIQASATADLLHKQSRRRTGFFPWLARRIKDEDLASLAGHADAIEELVKARQADGDLELATEQWTRPPSRSELTRDLEVHYADYLPLLDRSLSEDGGSIGGLPTNTTDTAIPLGMASEVAARIEAHPLDRTGLRLVLRRYQEFGARFLLCQERTLLGDEMGLGKTVMALAAMNHVANTEAGARFLVICPASIVPNWTREIGTKTPFEPRLVHGDDRNTELQAWLREGGVAVTSFSSLRSTSLVPMIAAEGLHIDLTVVDEAHYVKNPRARRSQAVVAAARYSKRISLMTGTPLENTLDEFANLVQVVSPTVAAGLIRELPGSPRIGSLVAPVYLRRNQEDVLKELPERIDIEERVDLSFEDLNAYRLAIWNKNYMGMRRATTLGTPGIVSAKLRRLMELIEEYRAEGRKVLVFSFFLKVLEGVGQHIPHMGALQGSATPAQRMDLVDRFQSTPGHAVLLAQITAGGVGLNLQAASAVILMEPQWKPSTEEQAIARAHRMGQTRTVVVHRLLARHSVDEKLLDRMAEKQALFDEHVRDSDLKEAAPEASEASFAREVIASERVRLEMPAESVGKLVEELGG